MMSRICVTGEGLLHDRFVAHATENVEFTFMNDAVIDDGNDLLPRDRHGLVIALTHGWDLKRVQRRQQYARANGWDILHCRTDGALGFIGPWVRANEPGCAVCAEWRRRLVTGTADRTGFGAVRYGRTVLPPPLVDILACIVFRLTVQYEAGEGPTHERAVYVLRGSTLTGEWHKFQRMSSCGFCGEVVDDDATFARFPDTPQRRRDDGSFRVDNPRLSLATLRRELCDWRYGIIPHVFRAEAAPLAVSVAEIPQLGTAERAAGYGRAATFEESGFIAVLEALERHAGGAPQGRRTSVRGCYVDLQHDAADPTCFGMHDPAFYDHPAFQLIPYTPKLKMGWVWGYSARAAGPILVPEQLAYYNMRPQTRAENTEFYCYESSNGCAVGTGLTEAVLYGLFEVIERDAFLLCWYARLAVPEVILDEPPHPLVGFLLDKVADAGYRMQMFDITNDFGVPSIWALATSTDDARPKSFSAAGAHFDPVKALLGALVETAVNVIFRKDHTEERRRELLNMLRDSTQVRALDDHVDLYTTPEAFDRLSFLLEQQRPRVSFRDAFRSDQRWESPDLTACLHALTSDILALGLDVIVVDLTPPEQHAFGLRTVKVLVPGTLPMTFGHVYRRTLGVSRLSSAPVALGYRTAASSHEDLDMAPHPFP